MKRSLIFTSILLLSYGSLAFPRTIIIERDAEPVTQDYTQYDIHPAPQNARYHWKPVQDGNIPRRAVVGGQEGNRILFICQSFYRGGVHPGKVVDGRCNITYGGAEIIRDRFRVLVGEGLDWRTAKYGQIPPNAVPGGFENGRPLYICHAQYGFHGVHPGKVVGDACNIGYGGQEILLRHYQVLVD